ncbi:glycosyltransferase [Alteromonas sp. 14N.309.X.WAT.G.H12]|uniref:glycosyltransferase n=1 Tax=Alteromonas sp. 14N.309.X.WAT.G.H12 TaxID=3120824 RepID=UPI002FD46FFC
MKEQIVVTIVIPCYQQGHLLPRALGSVAKQTYTSVEVIVIDDGSVPAVSLNSSDYPFPITLIKQDNQGLPAARNRGLRAASGSLVKFMDADDELLPHCLSEQVPSMSAQGSTISCIGCREVFEDTGDNIDIVRAIGNPLHAILLVNLGPVHNYLFKKADLTEIGGFDESERTQGGHEDYDLVFRLLVQGSRIVMHHTVGVIYHRYSGTMSTNLEAMHRTRANVWAYNVRQLLEKEETLDAETLLAVLICYSHLFTITPTDSAAALVALAEELEQYIQSATVTTSGCRIATLIEALQTSPLDPHVVKSLENYIGAPKPYEPFWAAQDIISYRTCLSISPWDFRDDYIIRLFQTMKRHKRVGIYGAGELGQRLAEIIESAGFDVAAIFDRNWQQIPSVQGIPVFNPDEKHLSGVDLVVIASLAYRTEIEDFLKASFPSLELF